MKLNWKGFGKNNLKREVDIVKYLYSFAHPTSYAEKYSNTTNSWSSISSYPDAYDAMCSISREKGYVVGGSPYTNLRCELDNDTWTQLNDYLYSIRGVGGDKLNETQNLTICGYDGSSRNYTVKHTISDDTQATTTGYPISTYTVKGGFVNNSFYGSHGASGSFNQTYMFSVSDTWTSKTSGNVGRRYTSRFVIDTGLFIIAGINTSGIRVATNDRYESLDNTWTSKTSYPVESNNATASYNGGDGFYLGGDTNSGDTNKVYTYNYSSNAWTNIADIHAAGNPTSLVI